MRVQEDEVAGRSIEHFAKVFLCSTGDRSFAPTCALLKRRAPTLSRSAGTSRVRLASSLPGRTLTAASTTARLSATSGRQGQR